MSLHINEKEFLTLKLHFKDVTLHEGRRCINFQKHISLLVNIQLSLHIPNFTFNDWKRCIENVH